MCLLLLVLHVLAGSSTTYSKLKLILATCWNVDEVGYKIQEGNHMKCKANKIVTVSELHCGLGTRLFVWG